MIQVKGSVLISRIALIRDLGGEDGLARVVARLPEEDAERLRRLLATGWYSFELSTRLDRAIVDELGQGRSDFFEQIGMASAEKNLSGVHKSLMVPGDPHGFLRHTPFTYRAYYNQGRREYEKVGPCEAVLTTYDAETFSEGDCATVVGWHRRALEMCGARGVRVVEEECRARGGGVCRYRLSWNDLA